MNRLQFSPDSVKKNTVVFLKTSAIQLREGILDNNPILVQLLGTCPTMAVSTSVGNAVGMGLATMAVLIFSNLLISLMRHFIPNQIRIAAYIVIISGFVSAVELLIKAYFPALDRSLGVFIPLIVVNCIILARAEEYASKNSPLPSVIDGLSMGLGFTFALIVLAAIREIIGAGTIAGYPLLGNNYKPALLFIMPPGAFITLGCLIALVQKLKSLQGKKQNDISVISAGDKSDNEVKEVKEEAPGVKQETDDDAAKRETAMQNKINAIRGVLLQVKNYLKNKKDQKEIKPSSGDNKEKNENNGGDAK